MTMPTAQIDEDFYGWLFAQAAALRARGDFLIDWENVAEELEAMGRNEENSLQSYLEPANTSSEVCLPAGKNNSKLGKLH